MSNPRQFVIAYHRTEGDPFTTRLINSLGLGRNPDDDNIGAVLVSPEKVVRKLSEKSLPSPSSLAENKDESDIQIGSEKSNYVVSLVGNYPAGVNSLATKKREALQELKSRLDKIQEGEAIHLLLEYNFGYSGESIAIALIVKEYLEKKLNGKTDNIIMTLQGSGGPVSDKAAIIADIGAVFGINIAEKPEKYFITRQELEKILPVYSADKKQGIAVIPFMSAFQQTIPSVVGKEQVTKSLARVKSKEHWGKGGSRTSTPIKETPSATTQSDTTDSTLASLMSTGTTFFSSSSSASSSSSSVSSSQEIAKNKKAL